MKTCFYCKGRLRVRRIEHMHHWRGRHYLIKKVHAEVCDQCGEAFFSPTTLKEIDRLVAQDRPTGRVSVAVFEMRSRAA